MTNKSRTSAPQISMVGTFSDLLMAQIPPSLAQCLPPPSASPRSPPLNQWFVICGNAYLPKIATVPRRVYGNAHAYHINSISLNSDGETYLSADDLRINVWYALGSSITLVAGIRSGDLQNFSRGSERLFFFSSPPPSS